MNVIARLEYELAYYDSAVHRFNHYTTRTPHVRWMPMKPKQFLCWLRTEPNKSPSLSLFLSLYIYIYIYMRESCVLTREGCRTRSMVKRSFTGLNLEFFFSLTSCHTKVKYIYIYIYIYCVTSVIERLSCRTIQSLTKSKKKKMPQRSNTYSEFEPMSQAEENGTCVNDCRGKPNTAKLLFESMFQVP